MEPLLVIATLCVKTLTVIARTHFAFCEGREEGRSS